VTGGGIEEALVEQVAAGELHSMALTRTGELYSWGTGNSGQLGHGDKEDLAVPRVVDGINGAVIEISGGESYSLVTTAEGSVHSFGTGDSGDVFGGRLGLGGEVAEALTPTAIDGITLGDVEEGKEGKE
jgi:alpha-tubulin suppressor-like RCC1 family protein